jgi:hypothetical protein
MQMNERLVTAGPLAVGSFLVALFAPVGVQLAMSQTPPAPVTITINESIKVGDGVRVLPPAMISINEGIKITDGIALTGTLRAVDDSYSTIQDTSLTVPAPGVLGNDTGASGVALTAVLVSGPAHGMLQLNADGSFTYTPNAGYTGPDSFTYQAAAGSITSNVANVSVTVLTDTAVCTVNCAPGPGETPELDSLLLFGSGLSGLGAYALARFRAKRRPQG